MLHLGNRRNRELGDAPLSVFFRLQVLPGLGESTPSFYPSHTKTRADWYG